MSNRDTYLQMPIEERVELCKYLQDSIITEMRMGVPMSRPGLYLRIMEEILGVDEIPLKCRKTEYTWARYIIAYQLLNEGMTEVEVGRHLGKDHSSVNHMKHKMEEALMYQSQYQDVVYMWKQFKDRLEHETNRRTDKDSISL